MTVSVGISNNWCLDGSNLHLLLVSCLR